MPVRDVGLFAWLGARVGVLGPPDQHTAILLRRSLALIVSVPSLQPLPLPHTHAHHYPDSGLRLLQMTGRAFDLRLLLPLALQKHSNRKAQDTETQKAGFP